MNGSRTLVLVVPVANKKNIMFFNGSIKKHIIVTTPTIQNVLVVGDLFGNFKVL